MGKGVKNQMGAGRPKTAVDKANLPEKITSPSVGELPKKIIGSHTASLSSGYKLPKAPSPPKVPKL